MANNLMQTSKKLIQALNSRGHKMTMNIKQFIGREGQPHNMYSVNKATWDDDRKRYSHEELYSSTSMVRITLFLRDMWFEENGWELPTDQEQWNAIREGLREKNG